MRKDEQELVCALLSAIPTVPDPTSELAHALVQDMADGGMGSIRFLNPEFEGRSFGREIAAADYVDQDGVPVDITVNLDDRGDLFEVDFWKVDYSPLLKYPRPQDIRAREAEHPVPRTSESTLALQR